MKEYIVLYKPAVRGQHTLRACNAGQDVNLVQLSQPLVARQAQVNQLAVNVTLPTVSVTQLSASIAQLHKTTHEMFLGSRTLRYLVKEVPGDGSFLAQVIFPDVQSIWEYPNAGQAVGTEPPFLAALPDNPMGMTVERAQLKALVTFYNNGMTVAAGDTLDECQDKLRAYLSGYL
ncbi:hypothetical protein BDV98DRAFT_592561 [Pterulicium gracile]|uniref:Uncharacterized protein n=1 Tax=Pterulicium gracile TaxID=1884261 RepID=A0A5C3QJF5_9AGAR|nr:hypothetical protein BDV98DRAFT_592561 [Pterula gracilis]